MLQVNPHVKQTRKMITTHLKDALISFADVFEQLTNKTNLYDAKALHSQIISALEKIVDEDAQPKNSAQGVQADTIPLNSFASNAFKKYQQTLKEDNIESEALKQISDIFKDLSTKYQKKIIRPIEVNIRKGENINGMLFIYLKYVQFGLDNLSSLTYDFINSGLDWLVKKTKEEDRTIMERIFSSAVNNGIGYLNLPNRLLAAIFDIPEYLNHLKLFTTKLERTNLKAFKSNTATKRPTVHSELNNVEFSAEILKTSLSDGSASLDKLFSSLDEQDLLKFDEHGIEKRLDGVLLITKEYIISKILVQIRSLERLVQTLDINNGRIKINPIDIIQVFVDEKLSEALVSFVIVSLESWIQQLCKHCVDNSEAPHRLEIMTLCRYYLDLLNQYQLLNVQLPIFQQLPGISIKLHNVLMLKISKQIDIIETLRENFESLLPDGKKQIIMPIFEHYIAVKKDVTSGAQKKSKGSGFYQKEFRQFFLKQVDFAYNVVDDVAEYLISSLARKMQSIRFALCDLVKTTNTNEVFVASTCSAGFEPIMTLGNRFTTRLTKHESDNLFGNITRQQIDQMTEIMQLCIILCDYDPNPANLGFTSGDGIIKIDHGWGLDGLCADDMKLWHDELFPLRYIGRIAPTNAIANYSFLFKKEFDYSWLKQQALKLEGPTALHDDVYQLIHDVLNKYRGATAPKSLRETYDEKSIVQALVKRLGLKQNQSVDAKELAIKISEAIYQRTMNLYLISILHNVRLCKTKVNKRDHLKNLKDLLKIFNAARNLRLLKKLYILTLCQSVLTNEKEINDDLRNVIDTFVNKYSEAKILDVSNDTLINLGTDPSEYGVENDIPIAPILNISKKRRAASETDDINNLNDNNNNGYKRLIRNNK